MPKWQYAGLLAIRTTHAARNSQSIYLLVLYMARRRNGRHQPGPRPVVGLSTEGRNRPASAAGSLNTQQLPRSFLLLGRRSAIDCRLLCPRLRE